jgi:protein TonB
MTFVVLMLSVVCASAQETTEEAIPISYNEERPTFNGGDSHLLTQWVKERQVYPSKALKSGLQGRVTIRFTITETGKLKEAEVVSGVHKSLDRASLRLIKSTDGRWTPGKDRHHKPCSTTFLFPVIWQLPEDD